MRSWDHRILLAMAVLSVALPLTLAAQPPETHPQRTAASNTPHALLISSGDLLEVVVFDTPELSGRLRVNEIGEVTIPIAGAVRVSGMTAENAAATIENKLRGMDVLKDPHVSIFISEYATQGVTVTGEVKSPGSYALLGSHGLLEMISAAGGTTPGASRSVTVSHKSDPEHPEVLVLDTRPGSIPPSFDLRPGDTIVVSKAEVAYVVGEIAKPGVFVIEGNDRLTLLQLVALAGGTRQFAAQDKAHLIRKTANGREDFIVPLKEILRGKAFDTPLKDGDILFVPTSGGKTFAFRGMEAAVALTTGLILSGRL
jgi:polysaccharide export outer membrane protein